MTGPSEKQPVSKVFQTAAVRKPPFIQIPSHVFFFALMMTPVAAFYAFYEKNKKSDEELEKILTDKDSRYRETVNTSRERRAEFQTFFNKLKDGSDPDAERRMKEALHGGKGDQKRLYSVDKTLYGTEEGVAEKQRASEELKQREDERMRRKKKKKKVTSLPQDKETPSVDKRDPRGLSTTSSSISSKENLKTPDRNRIWTAMAAGSAVALSVALIFGGRPRSS